MSFQIWLFISEFSIKGWVGGSSNSILKKYKERPIISILGHLKNIQTKRNGSFLLFQAVS